MSNYHVTKSKSAKSWKVVKVNSKKASATAKTQKEAEKIAKKLCSNNGGGEVRIHGVNGKIRDSDTVKPGNESKTKDTKF